MSNKEKFEEYYMACDCGNRISFETKQPEGAIEPVICGTCWSIHQCRIPEREGTYLYTLRDDKLKLRLDLLKVFAGYKETMTVRQMFYRLISKGYEKSEKFYDKVQAEMKKMRLSGALPFAFVADNTRSFYRPTTYSSMEQMLESSKQLYRRSLWDDVDKEIEIWLEKEALRGVFWPITQKYDVPLFITKGFSSLSFVQEAAVEIKNRLHPTYVYLFTDRDPSGMQVANSIEKRMKEFGVGSSAIFERIGLTAQQVSDYNLPSRPTKSSTHSKGWEGRSVELDALEPKDLRNIVESCITQHIDDYQYNKMLQIEEQEKATLETFISNWNHN